ncbi:Ig-like domain-containing protein [Rhodococcus sp. D2-41]|uniref:Ig-like domain-containing protein n=1 Tax=Speluncibacter jeojiensis TaxID=2710754 RepID=UPI002410AD88|nr:Ig-like domain-containing protein [Rhodococcus sp. D2-41]MDG3012457.1 Ig-like domain-containing protein [Rhodococcus sp. D2-41]
MANVTYASLVDKNDNLVIVPRQLAVLVAPYSTPIPAALTDATGLVGLPAGWSKAGQISREKAELAMDGKTDSIQGYGSMVPRRVIKTEESMQFNFSSQELKKLNYELFFGQDLSDVQVDGNGEWRAYKSAAADIMYYSVILIGRDGGGALEVFPYWIFPKMSASSSGSVSLEMAKALEFPISLNAYEDPTFGPEGSYVAYGMAGRGNIAIADQAGFGQPITAITVTPSTKTLAAAATQQLAVKDSNNVDRTALAAYESSDPAKATVTAGGLVTGVATGSATITATYQGKTASCAITVS